MSKYNLDFDRLAITYPKKVVNNLLDEANTKSVFLFLFKLITYIKLYKRKNLSKNSTLNDGNEIL